MAKLSQDSKLGELMTSPAAMAILEEYWPGVREKAPLNRRLIQFSAARRYTSSVQIPRLTHERERLTLLLSRLAPQREDRSLIATAVAALDDKYDLARKMAREPGLEDILKQLTGRVALAFGGLHQAQGKRILDIACGSNTRRARTKKPPSPRAGSRGRPNRPPPAAGGGGHIITLRGKCLS